MISETQIYIGIEREKDRERLRVRRYSAELEKEGKPVMCGE